MTGVPRGMELSRMVFTSAVQVKTSINDAMRKHESGLTRTAPRVATLRTPAAQSPAIQPGHHRSLACRATPGVSQGTPYDADEL